MLQKIIATELQSKFGKGDFTDTSATSCLMLTKNKSKVLLPLVPSLTRWSRDKKKDEAELQKFQ